MEEAIEEIRARSLNAYKAKKNLNTLYSRMDHLKEKHYTKSNSLGKSTAISIKNEKLFI